VRKSFDFISKAKAILEHEAHSVAKSAHFITPTFSDLVEKILTLSGRLVVSGVGKSALVAQKIVATLNSTGTPAVFMHAADAVHGDLGMLQSGDLLILISQSGETAEILYLLQFTPNEISLASITGNPNSTLAQKSTWVLNSQVERESCLHNLAPTDSALVQMALGDALAVCLMEGRSFQREDFARYHPAGNLGKRLYITIGQLAQRNSLPMSFSTDTVAQAVIKISEGRMGAVAVVNDAKEVLGIFTDGDLRRSLLKCLNLETNLKEIMTKNPLTTKIETLAVEVLQTMKNRSINQIIVVDSSNRAVGMVHLQDLLKEGL
jgi:arabinose-5-phosphate isomerase